MRTLTELAEALQAGRTTSRQLVEQCLERIADPAGEGARVFITVETEAARAQADATDLLRKHGRAAGPYAGIPVSLKDLLDVAGHVTTAGSTVLSDAPPAAGHAPVVARMLGAGFVPVGRTNMTEFAFSGIGLNPHYGTPASPWDRATRRIPGGSSSGAAVSVADGMAFAALGTDTGGSCRIPAALCGLVGYKPTARRVPLEGVLPLAFSLDSVGPLANSVACCAIVDAVLAAEPARPPPVRSLAGVRLALPTQIVTDDMDAPTAAAFDRALAKLSAAGAVVERVNFAPLLRIGATTNRTSFAACEAYAWHRALLARGADRYDPRVRVRIEGGAGASAADYLDVLSHRRAIIADMARLTAPFDALVMPTVPTVPPPIAALEADDATFSRANALMLRNTSLGNFLDRCAISLPCHRAGDPPAGLMLVGETAADAALFALAAGVEAVLAADVQAVLAADVEAVLA